MIDAIDGLGGHHLSQPQYWRGSRPVRFHAASLSWDTVWTKCGQSVDGCNDMIRTDPPDKPGEQGFIVFSRKGNPKSVLTLK